MYWIILVRFVQAGRFGADYLALIIDVGHWGQGTINVSLRAETLAATVVVLCCGEKEKRNKHSEKY